MAPGRGYSISGKLSRLQEAIPNSFFDLEGRFFYLNHRETADLDLFATADVLGEGVASLRTATRAANRTRG